MRSVTEKARRTTCPLCKGQPTHNTAHFILDCDVLREERRKLEQVLWSQHRLRLNNQSVYNPPTAAKHLIDNFLTTVDLRERDILQQVNFDLTNEPDDSIDKILDVKVGHDYYRTRISGYNHWTKEFTLSAGSWDIQGPTPAKVQDLNTLGEPGTLDLIPDFYALKFNPITSTDNLGKHYLRRGKLVKVTSLQELQEDLLRGAFCSCPFNGNVARRYATAARRESNAIRHGVN